MNSNKDWTDKLPELFESYTEVEPEGLWDAVRAGIEPKKKRPFAAWWYAGGILAAAAIVTLVLLLHPAAVPPAAPVSLVPGEGVVADNSPSFNTQNPQENVQIAPETHISPENPQENVQIAPETHISPEKPQENVQIAPETHISPENPQENVQIAPETHIEGEQRLPAIPAGPKPRTAIRVEAGITTSGLLGQTVSTSAKSLGATGTLATKSLNGGGLSDLSMINRNKQTITAKDYSKSVSFSFSLKANLNEYFGIESGIMLTELHSVSASSTGNSMTETKQDITYFGVPLNFHYNAFEWRRFGLYLYAGPMYEFSSSAHVSELLYQNGRLRQSSDNYENEDDKLWSLNVGAGLQLRLSDRSSVFVQPGFSYHFSGSNSLDTYYKAKPAATSIAVGYRLSIL